MKLLKFLVAVCLAMVSLTVAAGDAAKVVPTVGVNTIYRCYKDHYEPPCIKVAFGDDSVVADAAETDWAELIAASRAYRSGVSTPVLRSPTGPIPQCGNGHGQTACCRIVGYVDDDTIVQCG